MAAALAAPVGDPVAAQVGPDPTGPTLAYAPASDLVDGQEIEVTGTGYEADSLVIIATCGSSVAFAWDCDLSEWVWPTVLGDGTFSAPFVVTALAQVGGPDGSTLLDCRAPAACDLVVLVADPVGFELEIVQRVPLLFDADAPLLPPPTLGVEPSSDLVDGQVVSVTGTGFRSDGLDVVQCVADQHEPGSIDGCRYLTYPDVVDGTFAVDVVVRARLRSYDPETGEPMVVDCRSPEHRCVLTAGWDLRTEPVDLHFDPVGELLPPPAIEVSPHTDLGDGDLVTVSGTEFGADGYVRVATCEHVAEGEPGFDDPYDRACDVSTDTYVPVGQDGSFSTTIEAYAEFEDIWQNPPRSVNCRVAPGCDVVVVGDEDWVVVARPVSFGPSAEPRGRYLDPVFDDVDVTHDVHYLTTTDHLGRTVELRMDIYEPAGDTAQERPVVMWMHGGWFVFGDKADMAPYARDSARRGYVGISLQYRLRPDISIGDLGLVVEAALDAYDDATAAVSWLQEHAATYRIDPEAITAGGYSAGGVNAFHLAYMPGQRGPAEPLIAAAMPIAGIPFVGPEPGDPPLIGFHATDDSTVPASVGRDRCAEAVAIDVVCEWVEYPSGGHGIVTSRFRDIVRRGYDFLAEQALDPLGYLDLAADGGGPYEVVEGSAIVLDGAISRGASGGSWAPTAQLEDADSLTPTFTGVDDGATPLTLTARDHFGAESSDVVDVVTVNAPPVIERAEARVERGRTIAIDAVISDPGLLDTHQAEVDWGDGTVSDATVVQGEGSATIAASHAPARSGTYDVSLEVTDDDGGTAVWQGTVKVGGSGLISALIAPIRQAMAKIVVEVVAVLHRLFPWVR